MAITANSGVPEHFQSGDTIRFEWSNGDHPPSAWSAVFSLSRDGIFVLNVTASESGSNYSAVITSTQSRAFTHGRHQWMIRYTQTSSGESETGEQGVVMVLPNLATSQTPSAAQAMLTAIDAAITSLSAGTNSSVSFNGQSFTKKDLSSLWRTRREIKAEVEREKQAQDTFRGLGGSNSFQVRFQE